MSKKLAVISGILSISCPVLLLIFFSFATAFEQISRSFIIYEIFASLSIFWMILGYIPGFIFGILAIVYGIKLKKADDPAGNGSLCLGIIGVFFSTLWIIVIILMFPAWMGI